MFYVFNVSFKFCRLLNFFSNVDKETFGYRKCQQEEDISQQRNNIIFVCRSNNLNDQISIVIVIYHNDSSEMRRSSVVETLHDMLCPLKSC